MSDKDSKTWTLQALTDIWTGDADGRPDRLITTGLLGSIRWWFEVLVRGLGGRACDPTSDVRCPDSHVKDPTKPGHHCVVCELFGCTGWARKFRFAVLKLENGREQTQISQIAKGDTFLLRFTKLRPIQPEEWALLDLTLRLIADYGAIGGKTVYKPSEEWGIADLGAGDLSDSSGQVVVQRSRRGLPLQKNDVILEVDGRPVANCSGLEQLLSGRLHGEALKIRVKRANGSPEEIEAWAGKRHHQDYGLVVLIQRPDMPRIAGDLERTLRSHVQLHRWRVLNQDNFAWASLKNFWCVKGRYLARTDPRTSTFNRVIGRKEPKAQAQQLAANSDVNRWLAGRQQESKKVFSFKCPASAARTFGFAKPDLIHFDGIRQRLRRTWPDLTDDELLEGSDILERLFSTCLAGG